MASMMALVALAIDAMLPALSYIAQDFAIANQNNRQLVVMTIFAGLATGQFFYGPVSDSTGRKPMIVVGLTIFLIGSVVCIFTRSFDLLLLGRFLQGFGAAATRNIAAAIVRDGYRGNEMAKIMSIIMAVFVAVPMFAPLLGQLILFVASWRSIFIALFILAIILFFWFMLRQPETLLAENRKRFSLFVMFSAYKEVVQTKITVIYTLVNGLVFGAFVSFLGLSQQILQEAYATGKLYALYFALLVMSFCFAAIINSRYVMRLGAPKMVRIALICLLVVSLLFILPAYLADGKPAFVLLISYLFLSCFAVGLFFGNVNAIALLPLGHIAGTGSAVVGGVSTLIAVCLATYVGQSYTDNIYPILLSFLFTAFIALLMTRTVEKSIKQLL